jgi:hypothetical protein
MTRGVVLGSKRVLREPGHLMGQALKAKNPAWHDHPATPKLLNYICRALSASCELLWIYTNLVYQKSL